MTPSPSAVLDATSWLADNGVNELELLMRAIVFRRSAAVMLLNDDRQCLEASVGASKLLGLTRANVIGRSLDEFANPELRQGIEKGWSAALEEGRLSGEFRLGGVDCAPREIAYCIKPNLLPRRHLLKMRETAVLLPGRRMGKPKAAESGSDAWIQDYALFLLDTDANIAAWFEGAERVYGYSSDEVMGRHVSILVPDVDSLCAKVRSDLKRAQHSGNVCMDCWHSKKGQARLWVNAMTMALKDENGELQGFACVIRDFGNAARGRNPSRIDSSNQRSMPTISTVGIVSGEFDQITEANDAFLELVGANQDDVQEGRLHWTDLIPPEQFDQEEMAHEEGLRFGASTPVERFLSSKDGKRIPVRIATAPLKLSPFRWIAFVQDLRERQREDGLVEEEDLDEGGGHALDGQNTFDEILGNSSPVRRVKRQIEMVAPTDATVLILGETGTGKELTARAIHRISSRRNYPFVTLNCAAIPTGLLESEMFGHERGAFTGAIAQKIGRFEMANHGTLFLDEIGDIPLELQPKLLRALQEKSFERLGGTKTIPIDVRLVAATNRDLPQMVGDKLFRSDLYYRLKVFPITTPALRERPDDIPLLVRHFTKKFADNMGRQIDKIPPETMQALVSWPWPGNVRELENFMERSVIVSLGNTLRAPLAELRDTVGEVTGGVTLEEVVREHILRVLKTSNGVVTSAAIRLGLHRTTLNALMKRVGISRDNIGLSRS